MSELKFPDVGEGVTEGTIVKWVVKVGDTIKVDDILAEVETDKAIVEWPSSEAGTITQLKANAGDVIKVGQVVVVLDGASSGEKSEAVAPTNKESPPTPPPQPTVEKDGAEKSIEDTKEEPAKEDAAGVIGTLEVAVEEEHFNIKQQNEKESNQVVKALPAIRAAAKSFGVDLSTLKGSGANGSITMDDVAKAKAKASPSNSTQTIETPSANVKEAAKPLKKLKYNFFGHLDYTPYKGIRKIIGDNMLESHLNTAPVSHHDKADVSDLHDIRKKEKATYEKFGVKLTPLAFIVKAVCLALEKHPLVNSTIVGEDIMSYKYMNIGIAVDTQQGLLVPTIVKAQDKSIQDIAKEIQELAQKARDKKLNVAEMKNGTFTITNYGSIGGIFATPVINYPQAAILGLGRAKDEPVIVDGKILARTMQPMSLTFDHRVLDGAEAARFMNTLKEYLEDPNRIMVEEK